MVRRPLVLRLRDAIGRPLSLGMGAALVVLVTTNLHLEFVGQPGRWWGVRLIGAFVVPALLGYRFDSRIDEWADRRGISEERALRSVLVGVMGSNLVFLLWQWRFSTAPSRGRIGTFLVATAALGSLSVVTAVLSYRIEPRRRLKMFFSR